jgi:hypothetical protein
MMGASTDLVMGPISATSGAIPSLAQEPSVRLVASTLADPSLVPGTTLIGAQVVGLRGIPLQDVQLQNVMRGTPVATPQPMATTPLLPYVLLGLGVRRGADQTQRYWAFTLMYPDQSEAREAGGVLSERIAHYVGVQDHQPLIGSDVVKQLDPIVRPADDAATVTIALRLRADRRANLLERYLFRDLQFLAPGQG